MQPPTLPSSVDLDHRHTATNGVRLHVVDAGPPDGKPHGFSEFWYG